VKQQLTKIFLYKNNSQKQNKFLDLCVEITKNNICSGFEFCILDENNFENYIDSNLLKQNSNKENIYFHKNYIASSVLYTHGGIFIDSDVIITKQFYNQLKLLEKKQLVFGGNTYLNFSTSFWMAQKKSFILSELINKYNLYSSVINEDVENNILLETVNIYDDLISIIDAEKSGYLMEKTLFGVTGKYIYQKLYFSDSTNIEDFFDNFNGIVKLDNEFTPDIYKNMNRDEFLKQDILLSKIFKNLLT